MLPEPVGRRGNQEDDRLREGPPRVWRRCRDAASFVTARSSAAGHDDRPIERIPVHYTYPEPFGEAECVYCFPVEQLFLLKDGSAIPAAWLQPGMRFRLEDGSQGMVTAVEPPRVWEPPSRIPNCDGNYARRVLGRVKHKGYEVLDVTFGGTTITTTPNHLFYSASRGAWVPVSSMRPGELLRGETGETSPILAISQPRQGFVELYGIEVEELHTYFVGDEAGSALVHNGMGDCFKKPASPALTHEVDPATGQWRPNPWHPDAVDARIHPPYRANPAHGPTSRGAVNPRKSPEPPDAAEVYQGAIRSDMGEWYGRSSNGATYTYFYDNAGGVHFSGRTGGPQPLPLQMIPIEIRRALGL